MIPFVILVAFLNGGLNIINKMVNVRAKQVLGMANGTLINYLEGTALAFALYHVSITSNWGTPGLIVLMVAGLTAAGLFFNWLDRDGSVLPSWLVHVGANLGTNAVGFILFGIL